MNAIEQTFEVSTAIVTTWRRGPRNAQRADMRSAASSRIVSPLSISFSRI